MSQRHPTWEAIVDYLESPDRAEASVGDHLSQCPRCRRVAAEIRNLLADLAGSRLPRPPREVLQRTVDAVLSELAEERAASGRHPVPAEAAGTRGSLAALKEVWATLVADSLAPNLAVRGVVAAAPRMLLYKAEGFSITLSLIPCEEAASVDVMGQVTPQQSEVLPSGGRALLRQGDREEETALSPHGEFSFAGQAAGMPEVSIVLADSVIRLHLPSDSPEA
ncbi:MAG: hypothetical protein KAY32_13815 [Candidatus Eisenbacteria sp.]|nr:hypothetical protein [Candidatus Eisenbacteria bacterium]